MEWSLEAQESHVAVMEHGVFKILCVSVNVAMNQMGRLQGAMPVQLINGQMVQCACSALPILGHPKNMIVTVPVKMATSGTT
jgi:hypothetical protein